MQTELLEEIGLTKSEIKVYLALLELGSTTTGKIVDKSKASSSKIYEILDKLIQKGLVSYIIKSGTKHFEAANPKRILDYVEEKKNQLQKQEEKIKSLVPQLELRKKLSELKSEATIYKGTKGGETAFKEMLNSMKKNDEWIAFPVSFKNKNYFNLLTKLHSQRAKRKLKARIILDDNYREEGKVREKLSYTKVKYVANEPRNPAIINVAGNITLINLMSEDVTVFLIDNKEVADSFRNQFEQLWQQDTTISKGFEAAKKAFINFVEENKNHYYDVIGAAFGVKGQERKYIDFFRDIHLHRLKSKVNAKLLFQQGHKASLTKEELEKYYPYCEFKDLPYKEKSPVAKVIGKNKTLLLIQEKEPTLITINNKEVTDSFRNQFDNLWNQETRVLTGLDAVQDLFEDMLNHGEVDLIGASGYFVDLRPKFVDEWEKRAMKKSLKWRNIVNPNVKGHRITKFPFAETKYTLPEEFNKLSVFWIAGGKVTITNWAGKEPIAVIIENEEIYKMYKKQFESLWNKDTNTYNGFEETTQRFEQMLEELKPGEEYYVLGASIQQGNKRLNEWLIDYHTKRIKKEVKANLLCTADAFERVKENQFFAGDKKMKVSVVKCLPKEFSAPFQINLYKDKVLIFLWDELKCFEIESKKLKENFKNYFDTLWKIAKK